jgi:hypothetical protein
MTANKNVVKFGGEAMVFPSSGPRGRRKGAVSINQPSINKTSKPLLMAADNVQRTPTPVSKKEKVNISKPLSNQEKQTTRANLLKNVGRLNVNISNLDRKIRSYPLSHPDRTEKVKELENLKVEREQLRKEIERLTTNYG